MSKEELLKAIAQLTDKYESSNNNENPIGVYVQFGNADEGLYEWNGDTLCFRMDIGVTCLGCRYCR